MANSKILRHFTFIICPARYPINYSNAKTSLYRKETHLFEIATRSFTRNAELLSKEKFTRDPSKIVKKDGTVIRKKTDPTIMINLINESEKTVLAMKAAEAFAKAKGLNLIKVQTDIKSARETYKLVSDAELGVQEGENTSKSANDFKTIVFSASILDHDIQNKMNTVKKNLEKNKKIKFTIKKFGQAAKAELVKQKIIEALQKTDIPVKVTSQSQSSTVILFTVEPILDKSKETKPEKGEDGSS